uniref:Uncharacterized protein n=1 Tax=Romanomermis culicivorax TaxID=13658 RepID=A0A915IYN7_ROMCU
MKVKQKKVTIVSMEDTTNITYDQREMPATNLAQEIIVRNIIKGVLPKLLEEGMRQKELQKQYKQMQRFQEQAALQQNQPTQANKGLTQTLNQGQFTNQQPQKDYSSVMAARQSQMNPFLEIYPEDSEGDPANLVNAVTTRSRVKEVDDQAQAQPDGNQRQVIGKENNQEKRLQCQMSHLNPQVGSMVHRNFRVLACQSKETSFGRHQKGQPSASIHANHDWLAKRYILPEELRHAALDAYYSLLFMLQDFDAWIAVPHDGRRISK